MHSGVVRLPSGRPARDPDTLLPVGPGSHGDGGHDGHG